MKEKYCCACFFVEEPASQPKIKRPAFTIEWEGEPERKHFGYERENRPDRSRKGNVRIDGNVYRIRNASELGWNASSTAPIRKSTGVTLIHVEAPQGSSPFS
ncbi:MAG: hypothetical protein ACLUEV_05635 [Alistipes sp.]